MDRADMHICVQAFMWACIFISLREMPVSEIVESYAVWMFNFIGNCQTIFVVVLIYF